MTKLLVNSEEDFERLAGNPSSQPPRSAAEIMKLSPASARALRQELRENDDFLASSMTRGGKKVIG